MLNFPCMFCGTATDQPGTMECTRCKHLLDRYGHDNEIYQAFIYGALLAARNLGLSGDFARTVAHEANEERRKMEDFLHTIEQIANESEG